jgi:hypothetical protein
MHARTPEKANPHQPKPESSCVKRYTMFVKANMEHDLLSKPLPLDFPKLAEQA